MTRITFAMLSLLALTAGCADTQTISSEGVGERYSRDEYSAAGNMMEFLVEVRGMPFGNTSQEDFNRALIDVLRAARPPGPTARYTLRPKTADVDRAYRLVLVFGPARNLAFETQCQALDSARFEPVAAGQVKVSATFCRKAELLSYGIAMAPATNVSDPGFRQMFAALLSKLFPTDNREGGGK